MKIAKKGSGIDTVTYQDALDAALCHGWIDGQTKPFDEVYFLRKFTPRRTNSLWSKRNMTDNAQHIGNILFSFQTVGWFRDSKPPISTHNTKNNRT